MDENNQHHLKISLLPLSVLFFYNLYSFHSFSNDFIFCIGQYIASLIGTGPQAIIKALFLKTRPKKKHAAKTANSSTKSLGGSSVDMSRVDMEHYQKVSALRKELYDDMYVLFFLPFLFRVIFQ